MALDGRSGDVLWQHWTEEGVFGLDCSADITGDGTNDCLATGKKGVSLKYNFLSLESTVCKNQIEFFV